MTIQLRTIPVRFLIRRSVRYLLVSHGFRIFQAIVILAALSFMLMGSRIAAIDQHGNPTDIVASIFIIVATALLLTGLNRRVMTAIDRFFFREAYNAKQILTELGEVIPTLSKTNQLVEPVEGRVARELELAAEVQRHLFPAGGLEDEDLEIYGTCLPALGVGGDYYDYFDMDERRTGIAIADVAGKGIAAALLMSTVQASLRCQLISEERPLADVVSSMNRLLQRSTSDRGYATFFLAEFNKATTALTYVNAGHNPPMLIRRRVVSHTEGGELFEGPGTNRYLSGQAVGTSAYLAESVAEKPMVRLLTTGGPIIGTFLNGPYEQETIQLQSGDILALYTDGVTEAVNPAGVEFGEEKMRSILAESLGLTARESAEKVIAKVLEWQGQGSQHDDITLIIMKVK